MKPKFFTGPKCSGCDTVKSVLGDNVSKLQVIDVATENGAKISALFNVRSLPTIIDKDKIFIGTADCLKFAKSL
jgi:glutaredoxin